MDKSIACERVALWRAGGARGALDHVAARLLDVALGVDHLFDGAFDHFDVHVSCAARALVVRVAGAHVSVCGWGHLAVARPAAVLARPAVKVARHCVADPVAQRVVGVVDVAQRVAVLEVWPVDLLGVAFLCLFARLFATFFRWCLVVVVCLANGPF